MRIGIIGLGLIGGSLAGALRHAGHEVTGWDRDQVTRNAAVARGIVDKVENVGSAAWTADVVILCVPVSETIRLVPVIASEMGEGTVLTDVASVKRPVVAAMESTTTAGRCVGGHPVAGKETSGIASADPEIFRGAPYAIVPGSRTEPASVETLRRLVDDIGGRPLGMDADAHDAMVARTSHLPQVLSSAFSLYLEEVGRADLKGSGARGMLRLAASDEKLWSEILTNNRDNVSAAILEFVDVLQGLDDTISSGHTTAIEADMRRAREAVS